MRRTEMLEVQTPDGRKTVIGSPGNFKLMGVMHGHWKIDPADINNIIFTHDPKGVNSGIAIVTPAIKIAEILEQPGMVKIREVSDEDLGRKRVDMFRVWIAQIKTRGFHASRVRGRAKEGIAQVVRPKVGSQNGSAIWTAERATASRFSICCKKLRNIGWSIEPAIVPEAVLVEVTLQILACQPNDTHREARSLRAPRSLRWSACASFPERRRLRSD